MKNIIYIGCSFLILFISCEKEIDLGYRSIDPLYVVEGRITNEGTEVIVSQTRDMGNGMIIPGLNSAVVNLTSDEGWTETLTYDNEGYYRPLLLLTGIPGATYSLSVTIGGNEYTSSSTMPEPVEINTLFFRWMKIMSEKMLFCTVQFEDIAGEENYYCYRMNRNGENYRWNVIHDRGNDGKIITLDVWCMLESIAEDNKEEDWEDILYEGDAIEFELQVIDRRTYDYLYSLAISDRNSSNPIVNFTGGCLGYFAAYSRISTNTTFSYSNIQPAD